MKLGLDSYSYHLHFGRHPDFENPHAVDVWWFLERVAALGLDGFQLDPAHVPADGLERIAHFAARRGLYVEHGMSVITEERLRQGIEQAGLLSAKVIRCFVGGEFFIPASEFRARNERVIHALRQCLGLIEQADVMIAIENHCDIDADGLLEICQAVDHERVGVCFDVGNTFAVAERPLEACRKLAPFILATHLKDVRVRTTNWGVVIEPVPLGQGHIDLPAILQILREQARPGTNITMELPSPAGENVEQALAAEDAMVEASVRHARQVLRIGES